MKIYVGSTNPVKKNAVVIATSETWPEVEVIGMKVKSGVSEQPFSDYETKKGAINRARRALKLGIQFHNQKDNMDQEQCLGVGLEGGVFKDKNKLWSTVWAAVIDLNNNIFTNNGSRFILPEQIAGPMLNGEEMGPLVARITGEANIKLERGAIGVITNNFVDRTEQYVGITKLALGLWYGKNWNDKYK